MVHTTAFPQVIVADAKAPMPRLRVISDSEQLRRQTPAWEALLASSAANEPMMSPTWLVPWWTNYGQGRELALGVFHCDDRLIGIAPMQRRYVKHFRALPFRRLEFLGADVDEQDGVCSEYLNVIADSGHEALVADAFADGIARGEFGLWDEVVLPALAADNPMTDLLAEAFRRRGLLVGRIQTALASYVCLPKTWDNYLQALPKKCRYSVTRAQRDLEEWAGGAWNVQSATSPAETAECQKILRTLHTDRWKGVGTGGAYASARFRAFHDEVLPRLAAAGAVELLWLIVGGEPIAAAYNIIWNNKVYHYQSGRKLDVPSHIRPGIVLIAQALKRAIEAGLREFDFLGGDALYKRQFAQETRQLVQLRVAKRTALEGLYRLAGFGVGRWRTIRKASLALWRRLSGANGKQGIELCHQSNVQAAT